MRKTEAGFVVLDGIDGCGKNTQAALIQRHSPLKVAVFDSPPQEPTDLEGKLVRDFLSKRWGPYLLENMGKAYRPVRYQYTPEIVQCVYTVEKLMKVVAMEKEIDAGKLVVANRWMPSAYAYSLADGASEEWILRLMHNLPMGGLNILLDVDVQTSISRKTGLKLDHYEGKKVAFKQMVIDNYRRLWGDVGPREWPWARWVVINGQESVEKVAETIAKLLW